jgi:hypothetical protein
MVCVNLRLPPVLPAVKVYTVDGEVAVGVPVTMPYSVLNESPAGRSGVTVLDVIGSLHESMRA